MRTKTHHFVSFIKNIISGLKHLQMTIYYYYFLSFLIIEFFKN